MTEISLIVTLNKQFNSTQLKNNVTLSITLTKDNAIGHSEFVNAMERELSYKVQHVLITIVKETFSINSKYRKD